MIRAAYIRDFIMYFCRNQFRRELQPAHVPPGRTGPSQKSFSFPFDLVMMRIAAKMLWPGKRMGQRWQALVLLRAVTFTWPSLRPSSAE
jgi:hypothetical protein